MQDSLLKHAQEAPQGLPLKCHDPYPTGRMLPQLIESGLIHHLLCKKLSRECILRINHWLRLFQESGLTRLYEEDRNMRIKYAAPHTFFECYICRHICPFADRVHVPYRHLETRKAFYTRMLHADALLKYEQLGTYFRLERIRQADFSYTLATEAGAKLRGAQDAFGKSAVVAAWKKPFLGGSEKEGYGEKGYGKKGYAKYRSSLQRDNQTRVGRPWMYWPRRDAYYSEMPLGIPTQLNVHDGYEKWDTWLCSRCAAQRRLPDV
jgi:hypothetical protein